LSAHHVACMSGAGKRAEGPARARTLDGLFRRRGELGLAGRRPVSRDPLFQELVARRSRFAWFLSAATLIIYFGFIFVIAFVPKGLGTPLGARGATVGLLIIVQAFGAHRHPCAAGEFRVGRHGRSSRGRNDQDFFAATLLALGALSSAQAASKTWMPGTRA
jgi:hypothetical protein